jgi:hypothetical protein
MPVSPFNTESAPIGDPKAVTPPTRPSPATNGAFGFVQSILPDLLNAHIRELGYSIADLASLLRVQPPELASLYGLTVTQDTRPPHLRIVK